MTNYKSKFPTKETNNKDNGNQAESQTNSADETVDRSSRVKLTTTRSATATRRNPDDLSVPSIIDEYFKKQGYSLRWVSVVDAASKTFTNKRINQFIAIGGDLVTPKDIKQLDSSFLQGMVKYDYREDFADDEDEARGNQLGIRKGDLILMKLPLEYIQEKRKDNAQLIDEQIRSATKEYQKRGLDVNGIKAKAGVQQVNGSFFE